MSDALTIDALTYDGLAIGKDATHFADGIEGLDMPDTLYESTPASNAGTWGGMGRPGPRVVSASLWMDEMEVGGYDLSTLRRHMIPRPSPLDEIPLAWAGLGWPEGEYACWARPTKLRAITDEEAVIDGVRDGMGLEWECSDPVIYDYEQTTAALWSPSSPVSSDEFVAVNAGATLPFPARRSWELRMTAHGTLINPWVRVDHPDGTWERIRFDVTMTGGRVLTLGADLLPRIGSLDVTAKITATSSQAPTRPSSVPYWWRLYHGSIEDEANVVTVGCSAGAFSGFLKVRSGWL